VLTLTNCPTFLRGDLTKWLLEVNTGVFVGHVSARVRDNLWERVIKTVSNGRATMVLSENNEQHLNFRTHNSEWEPIDFDGIQLILRPSPERLKRLSNLRKGFSNVSKYRNAQKYSRPTAPQNVKPAAKPTVKPEINAYELNSYVIVDVETTGLSAKKNEIIEIGALKITNGVISAEFQRLIKPKNSVPPFIENLTGISNELLREQGGESSAAISEFIRFVDDLTIVGHNVDFDMRFLAALSERCGFAAITNSTVDTMLLYSKLFPNTPKKLNDLAERFGVTLSGEHRALQDCLTVKSVYDAMSGLQNSRLTNGD
jgi:CRISPR-associated protein Cas2